MAPRVRKWKLVETLERGKKRTRLVHTRLVLWYHVQPDRSVLLVISRDPSGKEKDDFFFTTDLDMHPATVISEFANRWPIEDTFRNTKSTDTPPLRSFRPPGTRKNRLRRSKTLSPPCARPYGANAFFRLWGAGHRWTNSKSFLSASSRGLHKCESPLP